MVVEARSDTTRLEPDLSPTTLLAAAPIGVWLLDPHGRTLLANDALVRLLGALSGELVEADMLRFVQPADHAIARELLAGGAGPERVRIRLRRRDGHPIAVVLSTASHARGILCAVSPIPVPLHTIERLREHERRFREAERLGNLGSWEWDVRAGTVTFSDHLYEIFGLPQGGPVPTVESVVERTEPADRAYFVDVVREIADGRREGSFERRIHRTDGEIRFLRSNSLVLDTDDDGRPTRVVGVCRDVTSERRELERGRRYRELYEAEREVAERLRQLDELKFAFMSAVSHDLRSPLTTVIGGATTLRDLGATLDESTRRSLLDQTVEQANALDKLLSDLFDLERLRRGSVESLSRPVALCELVRSSIDELGAGALVEVDLPTPDIVAEVDPPKFERIVENLVRSAIQASPSGVPVHVALREHGDHVRLLVEDRAQTIPAHLRDRVFEPFAPGRAGEVLGRSGLSLAIVSRFSRLHGGQAWAEERRGGGNRFVVELPRRAATGSSGAPEVSRVIDRVASAQGDDPERG
jgi:signal transduction histidine kinase